MSVGTFDIAREVHNIKVLARPNNLVFIFALRLFKPAGPTGLASNQRPVKSAPAGTLAITAEIFGCKPPSIIACKPP
jgi:hypothetical protein